MSADMEALYEDIRRAEPGSTLYYELIRLAKDIARGEVTEMAKTPKAPPGTGKVPSKNGAKHDANAVKTANKSGKTGKESVGKHAGGKGGKK